jgi:hypothetical protein
MGLMKIDFKYNQNKRNKRNKSFIFLINRMHLKARLPLEGRLREKKINRAKAPSRKASG